MFSIDLLNFYLLVGLLRLTCTVHRLAEGLHEKSVFEKR